MREEEMMILWDGLVEMEKWEDVVEDLRVLDLLPMENVYFLLFNIKQKNASVLTD